MQTLSKTFKEEIGLIKDRARDMMKADHALYRPPNQLEARRSSSRTSLSSPVSSPTLSSTAGKQQRKSSPKHDIGGGAAARNNKRLGSDLALVTNADGKSAA